MSQISAKIVAHSKNEFGQEICSMEVVMPRFILAEFNTHRMFSRNSASSRAIPFEKMLKMVEKTPFIPIAWQKDHRGMQGNEYIANPTAIEIRNLQWLKARDNAIEQAKLLSGDIKIFGNTTNYSVDEIKIGIDDNESVTKQFCNWLLEPFMYHKVLVTSTEWENFFALRCPRYLSGEGKEYRSKKDYIKQFSLTNSEIKNTLIDTPLFWFKLNKGQAEIHMMELAEYMWDAMNESTPKELKAGEWHIPYGDKIDILNLQKLEDKLYSSLSQGDDSLHRQDEKDILPMKIATAMCARISYTTVGEEDKAPNYGNDIKLHDRLLASGHMSPFEHCAKAMSKEDFDNCVLIQVDHIDKNNQTWYNRDYGWSGNFKGFVQYRKTLVGENITK